MDGLDCKICQIPFDEDEHKPRHAPCGHGLCTACLRALIKDNIFECPKCRQKNKVVVPEDLAVNFDLIDVMRSFKSMKASLMKETPSQATKALNDEICKVHFKSISHRCLKCQMWICDYCLDFHFKSMGCSTISSLEAMKNFKEKHTKDVDMLVSVFEDDAKTVLSKIQNHSEQIQTIAAKKKELTEKAEQHSKEIMKLQNMLDQGSSQKKNLLKSKDNLCATNTPYAMMDVIEVLAQMKQLLRSWSIKNLGRERIDTSLELLQTANDVKDEYAEMVINNEKMYARLSKEQNNKYLHYFRKQKAPDGNSCMPYDDVKKLIPSDSSLVFLELSQADVVKGRVLIRLHKDMPNIREYLVKMITGQSGNNLSGVILEFRNRYIIGSEKLNLTATSLTQDKHARTNSLIGDVHGSFKQGYMSTINFNVQSPTLTYEGLRLFGSIEQGLDMLQDFHKKKHTDVKISDCGLVIEE